MDVSIGEPDVSPLQLQGPRSLEIMKVLFGVEIGTLRYFWLRDLELDGIPLVVSRTGWSSELGYEIYLRDSSRGDELWERIMAAGQPFGLRTGHTSTIRRIEGGMLSYHADMDINTNPFELGLDKLVDLDMEAAFIGKAALKRIKAAGIRRKQVGLQIAGPPIETTNTRFWPLLARDEQVGVITSAVYSPQLERNIALAMVSLEWAGKGSELLARCSSGDHHAIVVDDPGIGIRVELGKLPAAFIGQCRQLEGDLDLRAASPVGICDHLHRAGTGSRCDACVAGAKRVLVVVDHDPVGLIASSLRHEDCAPVASVSAAQHFRVPVVNPELLPGRGK
jgi:glycine cleavage system aminomethyltransferase T